MFTLFYFLLILLLDLVHCLLHVEFDRVTDKSGHINITEVLKVIFSCHSGPNIIVVWILASKSKVLAHCGLSRP